MYEPNELMFKLGNDDGEIFATITTFDGEHVNADEIDLEDFEDNFDEVTEGTFVSLYLTEQECRQYFLSVGMFEN